MSNAMTETAAISTTERSKLSNQAVSLALIANVLLAILKTSIGILGHSPALLADGINMGLYNYPVLMAADILLYESDVVPVGLDQKQHIEIARDIAENFNRTYGKTLKLPEGLFAKDLQDVPGIDGRKMSKSYGNTIPIFADDKTMRKQVMRIVTDSRTPEEPKDPVNDNLFQIFRLFATPKRTEEVRQQYLAGGLGYGTLKQELADTILLYFGEARQKFTYYTQNTALVDEILARGTEKARDIAIPVLKRMRKAVGLDR